MVSSMHIRSSALITTFVVGGVLRATNPPPASSVAPPADIAPFGVHPPHAIVLG